MTWTYERERRGNGERGDGEGQERERERLKKSWRSKEPEDFARKLLMTERKEGRPSQGSVQPLHAGKRTLSPLLL